MKHVVILPSAQEDLLLTLHKWQRQAEDARMRAYLPPVETQAEDEDGDGGLPPLPPLDDEYSTAADLGREE